MGLALSSSSLSKAGIDGALLFFDDDLPLERGLFWVADFCLIVFTVFCGFGVAMISVAAIAIAAAVAAGDGIGGTGCVGAICGGSE